jgi:prephenate dehydrogenase
MPTLLRFTHILASIHVMHDDSHDNIFADDDALDFIIYEELENQGRDRKDGKGGCFGIVVLLLIPVASVMLLSWK